MAVYNSKDTEITEDDFKPEHNCYDLDAQKYDYAEGKRQAEAYLFRNAAFPFVAVRVAMVVSYVTAWDVAEFLHFIGAKSDFVGPINAANSGYLSIQKLCYEIGDCLNTTPLFHAARHEDIGGNGVRTAICN